MEVKKGLTTKEKILRALEEPGRKTEHIAVNFTSVLIGMEAASATTHMANGKLSEVNLI